MSFSSQRATPVAQPLVRSPGFHHLPGLQSPLVRSPSVQHLPAYGKYTTTTTPSVDFMIANTYCTPQFIGW